MVSRHVSADPVEERSLGDGLGASVPESATTRHWSLKHKLMQVMKERDQSGRLGHIVQVGRCLPGGRNPRRQTRTRGAGQDAVRGRPCRSPKKAGRWPLCTMSCVKGFRKQEIAAWASPARLSAGDGGLKLGRTGLLPGESEEVAVAEHRPRVTGGGPGSCEASGLGGSNTVLGNVKRALLDGTYHAWGQKYAPRYLAEFSYRFNRRYQLADLVPRLAHVAVRTPPLPYRLLTVAGTYA